MSVLSSAPGRGLRRLVSVALALASCALTLEGCLLLGKEDECNANIPGSGPCASKTQAKYCRHYEDGDFWEEAPCEPGQVCIDESDGGRCRASAVGQPCQGQRDCGLGALCVDGTCDDESPAEVAACKNSPLRYLNELVTPLEVHLQGTSPVFGPTFWPSACGESDGPEQVVNLRFTGQWGRSRVRIEPEDASAEGVRVYLRTICTGTYQLPDRPDMACGWLSDGPSLERPGLSGSELSVYLVGAAPEASTTVRLRVVIEPLDAS